ncbi:MAG: secondary thiamine-phosphate synthase enzyme YjbQ [Anaerolineae bacterium]|jgi:secondary thiamine-phosphate synthase enzyme
MVTTSIVHLETKGHCDILDITPQVKTAVKSSGLRDGIATVFCPGSTGTLTTIEYESGVLHDLKEILDEIVPPDRDYRHHLRWGDDNGHSHVRAAWFGPSLTVPVVEGELALGTWQQIVFIDFDTRARSRRLVLQMMGK